MKYVVFAGQHCAFGSLFCMLFHPTSSWSFADVLSTPVALRAGECWRVVASVDRGGWRMMLHHNILPSLPHPCVDRLLQVSEAVSVYHAEQSTNQAIVAKQSETMGVNTWSWRSKKILGDLLPTSSASNLYALASAVVRSAHKLVVGVREEMLMEAVHRLSTSDANDSKAIKTVVDKTVHLVQEIRHGMDAEGTKRGVGCGQEERQSTAPIIVGTFLSSLSLFFRALPDYHHPVWQSFRNCSTSASTLGSALEDLIHLAAIAWKRDDCSNSEFGVGGAIDVDLGGQHGGNSHSCNLEQESCVRVSPWDPVIQVLSWGAIPILTAENALLSCVQAAANLETGVEGLGCREGTDSGKRDSLLAVVTAAAKGYHSLGVGQDLSTVLLVDLWGVAAGVSNTAQLNRYHPMDLCRLIARLTMV